MSYCLQNVYLDHVNENGFSCSMFRFQAKLKKPAKDLPEKLKGLVRRHVIRQTPVQQLEFKHQKIITELFYAFATDPERLLERQHYEKTTRAGLMRAEIS